jgi:DNA-binding CsgD family transcriptional regulator/pimeloyl-ACP methyl ester carboxylesterase
MSQPISYARTIDGVRIAYTVFGNGPMLLHLPDLPVSIDLQWEIPEVSSWYDALARDHTVVTWDPPGVGLSDRDAPDVSFDVGGQALEAVVDGVGEREFDVLAAYRRTPNAIAYAARNPHRVRGLLLWCPYAAGAAVQQTPGHQALINLFASDWKTYTEYVLRISTGLPGERANAVAELARQSISRAVYRAQAVAQVKIDATSLLPRLAMPTLVLHRRHVSLVTLEFCREVASTIPGARLELLDGESIYPCFGDQAAVAEAIEQFLASVPPIASRGHGRVATPNREPLTPREHDVLLMLARGRTNREIASEMHLSRHTVGHHVTSILRKIGAQNRTDAAAYAARLGPGQ